MLLSREKYINLNQMGAVSLKTIYANLKTRFVK